MHWNTVLRSQAENQCPEVSRNLLDKDRFNRRAHAAQFILGCTTQRNTKSLNAAQYVTEKAMLQPTNQKVTTRCPSGHKVRGNADLVGKTVKCPRCEVRFIFALTMTPTPSSTAKEVTDTGVMRILGSMDAVPPPPKRRNRRERPCPKCGTAVVENTPVCPNCNCYLGVLPTFLHRMSSNGTKADSPGA